MTTNPFSENFLQNDPDFHGSYDGEAFYSFNGNINQSILFIAVDNLRRKVRCYIRNQGENTPVNKAFLSDIKKHLKL